MKKILKSAWTHFVSIGLSLSFITSCAPVIDEPIPVSQVPVITTNAISAITPLSALGGGTITSNGGLKITSSGICWNSVKNPTILNFKTIDGKDSGTFAGTMNNLMANTPYYVRAYATNSAGTSYGQEITFKSLDLVLGSVFQGGKVAYILQVSDPGHIPGQTHGIIAAANDQSIGAEWGCIGSTLTGADAEILGTGYQNTLDIVAGCTTAGIAAKLCADLVLGTYTDWALPSKDELDVLYQNQSAIGNFSIKDYWSSSEFIINYSWFQNFGDGKPESGLKDYKACVRAIRYF